MEFLSSPKMQFVFSFFGLCYRHLPEVFSVCEYDVRLQ